LPPSKGTYRINVLQSTKNEEGKAIRTKYRRNKRMCRTVSKRWHREKQMVDASTIPKMDEGLPQLAHCNPINRIVKRGSQAARQQASFCAYSKR
jgi:hypothetical protein